MPVGQNRIDHAAAKFIGGDVIGIFNIHHANAGIGPDFVPGKAQKITPPRRNINRRVRNVLRRIHNRDNARIFCARRAHNRRHILGGAHNIGHRGNNHNIGRRYARRINIIRIIQCAHRHIAQPQIRQILPWHARTVMVQIGHRDNGF